MERVLVCGTCQQSAFSRHLQRFDHLHCSVVLHCRPIAELTNKSDHDLVRKLCAPTHALDHLLTLSIRTVIV